MCALATSCSSILFRFDEIMMTMLLLVLLLRRAYVHISKVPSPLFFLLLLTMTTTEGKRVPF